MNLKIRVALAALACSLLSMRAGEPLQLADLVTTALANNPEILAAQKDYEAARQRPARESSLPDPTLSLGYSSNGGPLPGQQLGQSPTSNIGLSVSQEIPFPGKRRLRGDIAAKEAEAEFWRYQAVQLNVRSRVIQAYHRLHHTYAALDILQHGKELLVETLRVSEARYSAGKTAQQDIFKAQVQLSMMEIRIIRLQQERTVTEVEINSLLNRVPGSPLGEPINDEPGALPMTLDDLLAKASANSPELERRLKIIARNELRVNLARKNLHTDYTISAGYFNQGTMPAMYQARVDIPLQIHADRNQRHALNEQVDLLSQTRRNFEAGEQDLQFRVRETWAAAETAWRLVKIYDDTILPQSQLTVDSSIAGYESGATDFVSVLNNLATRIDVEQQRHEEEMNFEVAVARLEEMTGVELSKLDLPEGNKAK